LLSEQLYTPSKSCDALTMPFAGASESTGAVSGLVATFLLAIGKDALCGRF